MFEWTEPIDTTPDAGEPWSVGAMLTRIFCFARNLLIRGGGAT